jgi:arylsulfatase
VELTDIAPTLLDLIGLPIPEGTQGRSLRPILTGGAPPDHHRDHVRCEYYDALDEPHRSHGTMYRDRRWKLNVYHGTGLGELYDLENDPHEFDSLWDSPAHQAIKTDLLIRSMDASVRAAIHGPRRITPY